MFLFGMLCDERRVFLFLLQFDLEKERVVIFWNVLLEILFQYIYLFVVTASVVKSSRRLEFELEIELGIDCKGLSRFQYATFDIRGSPVCARIRDSVSAGHHILDDTSKISSLATLLELLFRTLGTKSQDSEYDFRTIGAKKIVYSRKNGSRIGTPTGVISFLVSHYDAYRFSSSLKSMFFLLNQF